MSDKTPPKQKAAVRLAQEIVQAIYDNGLRTGDKYFSEAEALERHGVARATLREALRFLEMQGVITVRAGPDGGSVVGKPGWPNLASTLALLLQFEQAPFQSVLEARSVIEPGLAELAAGNATDEQIAAMAEDLAEIDRHIGNYKLFQPAYRSFWRHLAESTHNPVLAFLSPALRAIVDSGGFVPNEVYRAETLGRLRKIHARIKARDAKGARAAMAELETEFYRRLSDGYPRQMTRLVAWSDLDLTS